MQELLQSLGDLLEALFLMVCFRMFAFSSGAPRALSGCAVVNQAMTWFIVRCSVDADRPSEQEWYLLEVYHADSGVLLGNVTAKGRPMFQVDGIPPATECLAVVFAVNDHGGRSEPTKVVVQAIPPPSKLLTGGELMVSIVPLSFFTQQHICHTEIFSTLLT